MAFHAVGSCGTNWTCAHRSKMGSSWCNTGSCHSSQCLVALALAFWPWLCWASWPWLCWAYWPWLASWSQIVLGWVLKVHLCPYLQVFQASHFLNFSIISYIKWSTASRSREISSAAAALPRGGGVLFCRHPGFQCAEWVAISLWHWNFKGTNVDMEDSDYMHVYVNKDIDDTILETNYYEFIR